MIFFKRNKIYKYQGPKNHLKIQTTLFKRTKLHESSTRCEE